jgi:pimeloyl-ACP methyl ester carboxylesterase
VAEVPEPSYARSGDVSIAYQVVGEGPLDLIYVAEFWNSIEAQWEEPQFESFLNRLSSFSRLICFDQRGTGISDPVALSELPRSSSGWTTCERSWKPRVPRRRRSWGPVEGEP